jgi:hypothetical protein
VEAVLQAREGLRLQVGGFTADGSFRLLLNGELGPATVIQASSNLVDWLPILTNPALAGSIEFIDRSAANQRYRFYRAVE